MRAGRPWIRHRTRQAPEPQARRQPPPEDAASSRDLNPLHVDEVASTRIRVDRSSRANLRRRSTSRSRSSVGERPPHTRKVAGSKPAGTTTESPVQRWFSPGMVLIAPPRFKIIRRISAKRFGSIRRVITEARRCRPVRRRRLTGVKPCRTSPFGNGAVRRGAWSTFAADS